MMYYYLCASLPALLFGRPAPMSVAEFDERCREELSAREFRLLGRAGLHVSRDPEASEELPEVLAEMVRFEQYLRTRIAQRRSGRDDDRAAGLPDPAEYFGMVDFGLAQAASADSFEREKLIDRIRWSHLDDLECGHEFDFAGLCVYRCKLAILEKYRERKAEQGRENFNRAVERISSAAPAARE